MQKGTIGAKPRAVLHVGMAKCASTFIGDQALLAARRGLVSALVWQPFDAVINACSRRAGIDVTAFPNAVMLPIRPPLDRPFIGTNECLTGHFPQPLRLVSSPAFDAEKLKATQAWSAAALKEIADSALAAFDVRILLVVRDPARWLHSVYCNLVIMGVAQEPAAFFERFGSVVAQWMDVNYLLALYRALFGEENVTVLPIEMLQDDSVGFFSAVNDLLGAQVLVTNEARNVGLSDGASEHFRVFWEQVERVVTPQPKWEDRVVQYKQQTWEFLHYAILNDSATVKLANEIWGDDTFKYDMPEALVEHMRSRVTMLRGLRALEPYLDRYFPSR